MPKILCKRCGRELKSKKSIERGYGKICYEKEFGKNKKPINSLDNYGLI